MSTTQQVRESKNKKIIKDISFKDFSAVCQEYQIVEKATRELLELAQDINTSDRTRANIYKWIIEMNIGKPTQMNDINLKQENEDKSFIRIVSNLHLSEVQKAVSENFNIPYDQLEQFVSDYEKNEQSQE